jgi:hypothetical protein
MLTSVGIVTDNTNVIIGFFCLFSLLLSSLFFVLSSSKCICDICVCGRHACPPTPRLTHYDPLMQSEARQAYNGKFQPATRAKAPDAGRNASRANVPFEGQSLYKVNKHRKAATTTINNRQ